jgi:hypothetical protein
MKIYSAERGAGKTTMLIEESAITGAIIVVSSYPMVNYTMGLAMRLNLDIPEPITVTNYLKALVCGGLNIEQKYLVDDLHEMLSQMNVEAATIDVNCIEPIATRKEREQRARAIMQSVLDDFNALGYIHAVSPEEIREGKKEFYKKANEKLGFLDSTDDYL